MSLKRTLSDNDVFAKNSMQSSLRDLSGKDMASNEDSSSQLLTKTDSASAFCLSRSLSSPNGVSEDEVNPDPLSRIISSHSFDELANSLHAFLSLSTSGNISKDAVVKSLKEVTPLSDTMLNASEQQEYASSTWLRKVTRFPGTFFDQTLEVAARQGGYWIMSLLPIHEVVTVILVLISKALNAEFLMYISCLVLFYISIFVMILSTLRIMHHVATDRRLRKPIRQAIKALGVDNAPALNNHMPLFLSKSFMTFFISSLLTVLAYSFVHHFLVPCSELCLFSFVLCAITFFYGNKKLDISYLSVFAMSAYSGLPFVLPSNLPFVFAWISSPLFHIQLSASFTLNISLPSVACIGSLMQLCILFRRKSWKSLSSKSFLCTIASFIWLHMAFMFFPETSFRGMLRFLVGLSLSFLWLPLVSVYVVAVVIAHLPSVLFSYIWKLSGLLLLLLMSVIMIYGVQNGLTFGRKNLKQEFPNLYRICLAGSFCLFCVVPFAIYWVSPDSSISGTTSKQLPSLSFDQYLRICCSDGWSCSNNRVDRQVVCSHFDGLRVYWQGSVNYVSIDQTENKMKNFVNFLPKFLHETFSCTYGKPYVCDNATVARFGHDVCLALVHQKKCHLEDFNTYTYRILLTPRFKFPNMMVSSALAGADPPKLSLIAPHTLRDQVQLLTAGHQLTFVGFLQTTNSDTTQIRLRSFDCKNCVWTMKSPVESESSNSDESDIDDLHSLTEVMISVIHFWFYPLIQGKIN